LSEVLDLYFGEPDKVRRGRMIWDVLDRRVIGEQDWEQMEEESRRTDAAMISLYHEDS
jgi:hypothetical protein